MNSTKIFPLVLILLDFGASVIYACNGDIKKCIYWIAAAILNITVTFWLWGDFMGFLLGVVFGIIATVIILGVLAIIFDKNKNIWYN